MPWDRRTEPQPESQLAGINPHVWHLGAVLPLGAVFFPAGTTIPLALLLSDAHEEHTSFKQSFA